MRIRPKTPSELSIEALRMYTAILEGPRGSTPAGRAAILRDDGTLRGPFDALLRIPLAGSAVVQLGTALRFEGVLPPELRELAALLVVHTQGCTREWDVHSRLAREQGLADQAIEAIATGSRPTFIRDDQAAVFEAWTDVSTSGRLTSSTFERLREKLTEEQIVELLVVFGYYSLIAIVTESLEIS